MFTGLIEQTSRIVSIEETDGLMTLRLENQLFDGLNTGDSIAVDGTCLTIVNLSHDTFDVEVINETKHVTAFSGIKTGDIVNLERAMRLSDRLDGHLVAAHVDGVGEISSITEDGEALEIRIDTPDHLMKYMSRKGSVTVDGISLTLFEVDTGLNQIVLNIIPETQYKTNIKDKKEGSPVNIEADMVIKHIDHLMSYQKSGETNV